MPPIKNETTQTSIWVRILGADKSLLSPEAAQVFLAFDFPQRDKDRMQELAKKAQAGTLSAAEQEEIDNYGQVGSVLALLKAKARRSLKSNADANAPPAR